MTPAGVAADDGILIRFTNWITVSSSLWTTTTHGPSDPPQGSHREAAPPPTRKITNSVGSHLAVWLAPSRSAAVATPKLSRTHRR
jgi:hypothetical protein